MKTKNFIYMTLIAFTVGCGNTNYETSNESSPKNAMRDISYSSIQTEAGATEEAKLEEQYISSSAAKANADTSKKFVRTANMRFKVKNVRSSTTGIEDIVSNHDGFVSYTTLNSAISSRNEIPVSEDSILITTRFTVSNTMTIRVPNQLLDSTLRKIAKHIVFLDYRTITADDVTLQMLSNKLIRSRLTKNTSRLTYPTNLSGNKLNQTNNAEGNLLNRQMQADQILMENLRIQSNVDYSTIQLEFYQEETVVREVKYNDEDIEEYMPGFWSKLGNGMAEGWEFVKNFLIGLLTIWPIILLGIAFYYIIRRFIKTGVKK